MGAYLELREISKFFGSFVANDKIDLYVEKGTIHAIVGENGAGKSTLMNVLSGIYSPDEGEILIDGQAKHFSSPIAASRAGIGMVYQEFMLFPELSVLDNIIMGYEKTSCPGVIDRKASEAAVEEICREYSFNIPLGVKVSLLPVAVLQQVEIVKVLYRGADIIIFDEPTAGLDPKERIHVRNLIHDNSAGKIILIATHVVQDIEDIASQIMLLKKGGLIEMAAPEILTGRITDKENPDLEDVYLSIFGE